MRTPVNPDFFEKFLINRTEQTVNTAFLWLLILKELSRQPQSAAQLKNQVSRKYHNPHRTTFYSSMALLRTMKLIKQTCQNGKIYQITPKGNLIMQQAIKHLKSNLAIILGGEVCVGDKREKTN